MPTKIKLILIVVCVLILLYAPFVVYVFDTQWIYTNPFFRALEFFVGMGLASCMAEIHSVKFARVLLNKWWMLLIELFLLITGISVLYGLGISRGNYMLYSWVALPVFVLMFITLTAVEFKKIMANLKIYKIIMYLSAISYAFFLAQFFTWPFMKKIIPIVGERNALKSILSFVICIVISVVLHEFVEKPSKKFLIRKFFHNAI